MFSFPRYLGRLQATRSDAMNEPLVIRDPLCSQQKPRSLRNRDFLKLPEEPSSPRSPHLYSHDFSGAIQLDDDPVFHFPHTLRGPVLEVQVENILLGVVTESQPFRFQAPLSIFRLKSLLTSEA